MDEKHNRRLHVEDRRPRYKDVKSYGRSVLSLLQTQTLLTGCLLVVAVVLLFGIFSQFPTLFFVLVLFLMASSQGARRSSSSMDDRATRIGKNPARRFERAKRSEERRVGKECRSR